MIVRVFFLLCCVGFPPVGLSRVQPTVWVWLPSLPSECNEALRRSPAELRQVQTLLRGLGLLKKLVTLLGLPPADHSFRDELFTWIYYLLRLVCGVFVRGFSCYMLCVNAAVDAATFVCHLYFPQPCLCVGSSLQFVFQNHENQIAAFEHLELYLSHMGYVQTLGGTPSVEPRHELTFSCQLVCSGTYNVAKTIQCIIENNLVVCASLQDSHFRHFARCIVERGSLPRFLDIFKVCVCVYIYTYIYIYICVCVCIYIYIYMCVYAYTYIYMYIYMCVCVSVSVKLCKCVHGFFLLGSG